MSTKIFTRICVDVHQINEMLNDPTKVKEAQAMLTNLWTNVGHYKRAKECLNIGSNLHSKESIDLSRKELSELSSADDLITKVICE